MSGAKRLLRTSARRGFITILLGSGFGSVLSLALSPLITRLFDPGSFGAFTLVTTVAMVLTPVLSLRLEAAVPLSEEDTPSYALVHAAVISASVGGVILALLFHLTSPMVSTWLREPLLESWLWAAPILGSTLAIFSALNALAVRGGRYGAIARRNILMTIATLSGQILAGFLGYGAGGLIVGFAIGQAIGTTSLLWGSGLRSAEARDARRPKKMREALIRFRRVPLFLAPAGLTNALGLQAPVFLLSMHYSSDVVGWYGLTQRVLAAPLTLIGLSVAQVFLSEISKRRRTDAGTEMELFKRTTRLLAGLAAMVVLGLVTLGPTIFAVVFGSAWGPSGDYARILAVALGAQLISSPLSQTLVAYERNGMQLLWDVARLTAVCSLVTTAATIGSSASFTLGVLALGLSLLYALHWFLSWRTVSRSNVVST